MAVAKKTSKLDKDELYQWEGADRNGKKIKGEIRGRSVNIVKAELRRQGISANKVRKKPKDLFASLNKQKIKAKDIAIFSRQLATMMSSGVPLVQALDIVAKGNENVSMQSLINAVRLDIEGGSTLSGALKKHPLYFDDLFCNLVEAGEQGGILESLLQKIASYKEKTESIKGKIKKALTYPAAIVIVAFIITAVLLIKVVPQFEAMFQSFGGDLPAFTQMVVNMSEFFQENWVFIFAGIIGTVVGFIQAYKRSRPFKQGFDKAMLSIPIIGVILHKASIARFARTLSTMFAAGVPLVDAMEAVAGATGNVVYSNAVMKIREEVSTGQQLQFSMKQAGVFPHMVIQMVAIGEESGSLDSMLSKVADFYEEEVDNAVDSLSSLIEPLIMVILGILVGGLIIAMYLPIFKMSSMM
ncbi:MAG: type II secretion system F family protein [Methylococcales bacterium]|jgi:type IV pilus assembly protein PilC|nr:type II secretion system F family protein [Methylococcales bacterium]